MNNPLSHIKNSFAENEMICLGYSSGHWSASTLRYKNEELLFVSSFEGEEDIASYLKESPNLPIVVSVDDPSILHFLDSEEIDEAVAIQKFESEVPNGEAQDFYLTWDRNVLALVRKSFVDQIFSFFKSFEERVVSVVLAPISSIKLSETIRSGAVGRFEIIKAGDLVEAINEVTSKEPHEIDGRRLEAHQVLHFAAALSYVSPGDGFLGQSEFSKNREELFYKKLLTTLKMPALVSVLLILLINGVFFIQLNDTNQKLKDQSSTVELLDQKLNKLEDFVFENRTFLEKQNSEPQFAIVCDRIGYTLAKNLCLTKIKISLENTDRSIPYKYFEDRVLLEGISTKSQAFSKWVIELEKQDWVDQVIKQNYEVSSPGTEEGEFHLVIEKRDEKS